MRRIRGGKISMIFQEPMTSLNPVFTIGSQIGEAVRIASDMSTRPRPAAARSKCSAKFAFPRRKSGSMNIRTNFPAACVNGR